MNGVSDVGLLVSPSGIPVVGVAHDFACDPRDSGLGAGLWELGGRWPLDPRMSTDDPK